MPKIEIGALIIASVVFILGSYWWWTEPVITKLFALGTEFIGAGILVIGISILSLVDNK
jgi:hypothetical protein